MKGMRFTRNRQNSHSFGKFLAGNPTRPPSSLTLKCVRRDSSSQVKHVGAFFSKLEFRVFCYS